MSISRPSPERTADRFFEGLTREHQPLLAGTTGTLRFDVMHGNDAECWHLTIAKGAVAVSRKSAKADSIIRLDRALFDDITCGRANAMTAVLRGEALIEGNPELLTRFQRLFPGPESARTS